MEMIIRNIPRNLEYGIPGNWGTLIPKDVKLVTYNNSNIHAVIKYDYGKNDNRTINLCHDELHQINFESFGTIFEDELEKIGYKPNEVQQLGNKWYIIKDENGIITPFEKFKIEYDYEEPGPYSYIEHKTKECEVQGKDNALKWIQKYERFSNRITNIVITKIDE